VPELNLGQLAFILRGTYLVDAVGYNRVRGKPFRIQEIVDEANRLLGAQA
jgi:2-oxoglutarate/2-oxoacid ferredoxin oxidoreductase subunit alpha